METDNHISNVLDNTWHVISGAYRKFMYHLLPKDIKVAVKDAYWKDINHLRELGLIELPPNNKGIRITPQGRAYFIQAQHTENNKDGE